MAMAQHPKPAPQLPVSSRKADTLLSWLTEREAHDGLTAAEIADVSGIYDMPGARPKTRTDAARRDLIRLKVRGLVEPYERPARWYVGGSAWRA